MKAKQPHERGGFVNNQVDVSEMSFDQFLDQVTEFDGEYYRATLKLGPFETSALSRKRSLAFAYALRTIAAKVEGGGK